MDFQSFGLRASLLAAVKKNGYQTPTPIQEQAIPEVLTGKDIIGLAQTGTGKTAAFVLPILEQMLKQPKRCLRALVLVPTRELAEQVLQVVRSFSEGSDIRSCAIYGGASMGMQVQALRRGTHIIVACPGRLLDHMQRGTVRLDKIEWLILDEADQLLERGFLPDVRRIIRQCAQERQTLLFSATMPREIQDLAAEILKTPVEVRAGGEAKPAETIEHSLVPVESDRKTSLLEELLRQEGVGSVLVFTRTKRRTERLGKQLSDYGFAAATLQGNLSQNRRQRAIDGFRSGKYQILVATDIAARGIDVPNITHVINYDVPETPEAYTHRIGRTGRASQRGEALTFISGEDFGMVRDIERALGKAIDRKNIDGYGTNLTIPEGGHMSRSGNNRPPRRNGGGGGGGGGRPFHSRRNQNQRSGGGQRRFGGGGQRRDASYSSAH